MAEDWLSQLLQTGLGYVASQEQARLARESAGEELGNVENRMQNYMRNLQNQLAPQLAGKELAAETAYKQQQMDILKQDLAKQAQQQEAVIRAKLAASGMSQSGALATGLTNMATAQQQALAKGQATLDAQILQAVQQRMDAANQLIMQAQGQTEQVIGQAAGEYDKAVAAQQNAGLNYLIQNLGTALPALLKTGQFALDLPGQGWDVGKTYALKEETPLSLPVEKQLEAAEKGTDISKATVSKGKYTGSETLKGVKPKPSYTDVIGAYKAHTAALSQDPSVIEAINEYYGTPGNATDKQKHIASMKSWSKLDKEQQNYVFREVTGRNSNLAKLLLEQGE